MNFIEAIHAMEKGLKVTYADQVVDNHYFYMHDGLVYHHSYLGDKVATIELGYFSKQKFVSYIAQRKKISGYEALKYMLKGDMVFEKDTAEVYKITNGRGLVYKNISMDEWSPTPLDINDILEQDWEI